MNSNSLLTLKQWLLLQDNLIKHGAIVFAGASVANALNYLFQLIMARLLTPIDYGVLIALFALFSIFVTGASAVSAISTKVSAALKASGELGKLKHFLMAYTKIICFFSVAVIVLVFFASGQIAVFLNINSTMLVLILFSAGCFSYFNSLLTGTLSGLQRFFSFAGMNASGAAGKFVLGMLLVAGYIRIQSHLFVFFLKQPFPYRFYFNFSSGNS